MNNRRPFVTVFVVAGLILSCIVVIWAIYSGNNASTSLSPTALYSTQLSNQEGKPVALGQWQGKVIILNFWATWCAPCHQEIPLLIDIQNRNAKSGLQIVGIAVDTADKTIPLSAQLGINYPVLIDEDRGIELSKRLGNRAGALPFTVLIDREGHVAFTKVGLLDNRELEKEVQKLI